MFYIIYLLVLYVEMFEVTLLFNSDGLIPLWCKAFDIYPETWTE